MKNYRIPDDPSFEQKGDPFSYGRHKRSEKEREVEWIEKLRLTKLEIRESVSTILSPQAPKPNTVIVPYEQSLDQQPRTKPKWPKKPLPKSRKKHTKYKMKNYKEDLDPPKVIDMRILGPEEAAHIKKLRRSNKHGNA